MNVLEFLIDIRTRQMGVERNVSRIQDKLERTERTAGRLQGKLQGVCNAFRSLPGAEFFTNPVVALVAATGAVSKLGMNAEKTAVSFNVLTGSMETGKKLLGDLNKYADETIYDRTGTQEAAKTMLGFGVSVNTVMSDLKMLGDVATGDKNRMQQLALVFGQIAAAGKLTGQDLLQLVNAGYNPLLDISALTGKSVAQLRDEMSKGLISFEMVRQAFQRATSEGGRFANMTETIAKTPFGRFQQLLGEATGRILQLYQIIQPALIPAFNVLSSVLEGVGSILNVVGKAVDWVRNNMTWLGPILTGVASAWAVYNTVAFVSTSILKGWTLAQYAQITAMMIAEKAQKLLNLAMAISPMGWLTIAISAVAGAVIYCWNKFDGFRAAVLTTWSVVKDFANLLKDYVIQRVSDLVSGMGALGDTFRKLFSGDFKGAWESAKSFASKVSGFNATKNLVAGGKSVVGGIGTTYQTKLNEQIKTPKAAAGISTLSSSDASTQVVPQSAGGGSQAAVTGGTRNTNITMNISKLIERLEVAMNGKTDTAELQRVILETINRSLEIATSTAR